MSDLAVRGECSECGTVIQYGDPVDGTMPATLFLTVPGRGMFAKTVWQAELRCKNAMICAENKRANG